MAFRPYREFWKTAAHAALWGVAALALTLNYITGGSVDGGADSTSMSTSADGDVRQPPL